MLPEFVLSPGVAAVRGSACLTAAAWEKLPVGFLAVGCAGSVLAANHAARELLDWPADSTGPLPEALREAIDHLDRHGRADGERIGLSFPLAPDCWREAWLTKGNGGPAGGPYLSIVLRSVDQQRKHCLESRARLRQLALISEITAALNSTLGLEETFNVILVGVTAGEGLGFNRAFLFLADETDEWLTGRTAIGPAGPAQAERIWNALAGSGIGGLAEAVCTYRMVLDGADAEVNRRVRAARIPRTGPDNPFADVIRGAPARIIRLEGCANSHVCAAFAALDARELACAPLRSRDRVVGLLLADHRITGNPIAQDSLRALELLAAQAGLAVERAALADKLAQRIEELRLAREKIEGIQEIVARLERFSVVGEIAAEVAHQIRNPMTIIGGFARNLLLSKKPQDPEYRGLNVICNQADRVCRILERIVSIEGWENRPQKTFALEPILRQSLEVMETRFSSRRVSWSFDSDLEGFTLAGRPDALRFALFKVFSGILQYLGPGAEVTVRAVRAGGGSRVVICPRTADNENTGATEAISRIFQGEWGGGPAQRNLALEYLAEHNGALGTEAADDGRPALVIDFAAVKEET